MRLEAVRRGPSLFFRAVYKIMQWKGTPVPDVVKSLLYKKPFWGATQNQFSQRVMRGPSEWTPGQRELFASFCSRQFQCPF
jgi:hypothetical protein